MLSDAYLTKSFQRCILSPSAAPPPPYRFRPVFPILIKIPHPPPFVKHSFRTPSLSPPHFSAVSPLAPFLCLPPPSLLPKRQKRLFLPLASSPPHFSAFPLLAPFLCLPPPSLLPKRQKRLPPLPCQNGKSGRRKFSAARFRKKYFLKRMNARPLLPPTRACHSFSHSGRAIAPFARRPHAIPFSAAGALPLLSPFFRRPRPLKVCTECENLSTFCYKLKKC